MLWIGGRGLPGAKSKRKPRAQWGLGLWVRSRAQSNTSWTPAKPLEDEWDKFQKHLCPEPGEGSPGLQETVADLSVASTGSVLLSLGTFWTLNSPLHLSQGLT